MSVCLSLIVGLNIIMLIEADMAGVIKLKWDSMHDEDINPKLYTLNPRF